MLQVLEHRETSDGTYFVDEESLGGQSLYEKVLASLPLPLPLLFFVAPQWGLRPSGPA
ncbi:MULTISPECIES: hypothetical protein [Streptomyces]|uniref:hypothetical protein n=1 Tax=Streptomyces TaxID=1883 RepID=UPI00205050AA|nr:MULTISPECIES: hypothetical protein [Streptomyces]UPT46668.1 hypothetical protein MWG59_38005 [Streptomyces sp. WAC00303]WIY80788.1 hypothetical protein QPM16_37635 [Streptomyces anulatus]